MVKWINYEPRECRAKEQTDGEQTHGGLRAGRDVRDDLADEQPDEVHQQTHYIEVAVRAVR